MIIFKRFIVLPTFRVHSSMQYHFRFGMRCTFSITKSFRVCEECVCVCAVCGAGLWFRRFSTLITFCCFCYVCCWSFESCCRYLSSRSNETPTTRIRSLFLELNVCTVHFQPLKSIRSKVRKHLLFEFNDLPINGVMMPISIFLISILSHMHFSSLDERQNTKMCTVCDAYFDIFFNSTFLRMPFTFVQCAIDSWHPQMLTNCILN